jgi:3-phosphoshikimate 1-carboxyvinyltransferase
MGALIECTASGTAPLEIKGGADLHGIDYRLPVASAQAKSCVLLAGLSAAGITRVHEPGVSRDHTERMLQSFGYEVEIGSESVALHGGQHLRGTHVEVPADLSSAAFFMVGALIAGGSDILLCNVGINPTRTGVLDVLRLMGGEVEIENRRQSGLEPVADLRVRGSKLRGCDIPSELVPLAIDEFPIIFIAAACAEGITRVTGAEELRHKESDRIEAMAVGLRSLGIQVETRRDGISIVGGALTGGQIDSRGDHRVAMAFAIAALRAAGPVRILDCANIRTSFPGFSELAVQAGLRVQRD